MTRDLDLKRAGPLLKGESLFHFMTTFDFSVPRPGAKMSYQKTDLILETLKTYELDNPEVIVDNPIAYVVLYVSIPKD
jgi:hypothetical protein